MLETGFRELLGFGRGNRGVFGAYLGQFMPQAKEGAMAGSKKLRMGAMLERVDEVFGAARDVPRRVVEAHAARLQPTNSRKSPNLKLKFVHWK